jgi:predicted deacylase
VLLEVGGAGVLDMGLVEMELRGFCNVFRHLGMLPGAVENSIPHTRCSGMYVLTSTYGGIFFPDVELGEYVEEGARLGEMRDLRSNVLAEFHSPLAGIVLMMFTSPVRISGETLMILATVDD